MALWARAHHGKLQSYQIWWPWALWLWKYAFSLSRSFKTPRDQRVMGFYGWDPVLASHHLAKFGGDRHCGSGDIMVLVVEEEDSKCCRFNAPLLFYL